ncbi:MAG TPA: DUF4382 domain-containing protein [Terriglobia bacterium]
MARRVFAFGLALALGCLGSGCGSSSSAPSTPTGVAGTGTLFVVVSDAPICDVLTAGLNVTQVVLGVANSGNTVTLLSSLTTVIGLDLASLLGFSTVLTLQTTNAGTYDRVSVGLETQTMAVYDPSQNPPFSTVSENLTTKSTPPLYNINPPLNLGSSGAGVILIDYDLQQDLQVDSEGNVTGFINPLAQVSAPTASPITGFGEIDGIEGFISSVNTVSFTSGSTVFTGFLGMQLLASASGAGGTPGVNASLTKDSALCAQPVPPAVPESNRPCTSAPLNTILTNSYALVDGFIDINGNLHAASVSIAPQSSPTVNNQTSFIGPVLSVTKDSNGNVIGFMLFVSSEQPPASPVSLDTAVEVSLSATTLYNTFPPAPPAGSVSPPANFAALPFGSSEIAVGEDVAVNGVFTVPPSPLPAVVAAGEVDLKLQTHVGSFTSLLAVQPDDHTGAFTLAPCATMLQQTPSALPIYVFTTSSTTFVNTSGLTGLRASPMTLVKGLLFFEPQSITLNGVTVPAGKLVMLAKQVALTSS